MLSYIEGNYRSNFYFLCLAAILLTFFYSGYLKLNNGINFQYYSHYSASKSIAEQKVLAANSDELRTCALRYRGIYGPAEPRTVQRTVVNNLFFFLFLLFPMRRKNYLIWLSYFSIKKTILKLFSFVIYYSIEFVWKYLMHWFNVNSNILLLVNE